MKKHAVGDKFIITLEMHDLEIYPTKEKTFQEALKKITSWLPTMLESEVDFIWGEVQKNGTENQ